MTAKKKKFILILVVVAAVLIGLIFWGNRALEVNSFTVTSDRLPDGFDGYRIAQVSDLHNEEFGEGNEKLVSMLSQTDPDIIVLTGDLIDSRHTDIEIALDFARKIINISPVYYVSGNHEARVREYENLKMGLVEAGVTVLENARVDITQEGKSITLIGVDDPGFRADYLFGDAEGVIASRLDELQNESGGYTILLSHRPELFETYVKSGVDLVFTGHAHGGQFRLPFLGGLVAPNQGFFPEYDAGLFTKENTTMIVSRGVGNSIIPVRINNRPEIIVVELKSGNQ